MFSARLLARAAVVTACLAVVALTLAVQDPTALGQKTPPGKTPPGSPQISAADKKDAAKHVKIMEDVIKDLKNTQKTLQKAATGLNSHVNYHGLRIHAMQHVAQALGAANAALQYVKHIEAGGKK